MDGLQLSDPEHTVKFTDSRTVAQIIRKLKFIKFYLINSFAIITTKRVIFFAIKAEA